MKEPKAYTVDKIVDEAFIGENIFKLLDIQNHISPKNRWIFTLVTFNKCKALKGLINLDSLKFCI